MLHIWSILLGKNLGTLDGGTSKNGACAPRQPDLICAGSNEMVRAKISKTIAGARLRD
jgi:hypothetical protein